MRWNQYTPYFNDGDTCDFGVNAESLSGTLKDGTDIDGYEVDMNGFRRAEGRLNKIVPEFPAGFADEIKKLIYSIDQEIICAIFGDHVEITAYADGRIETDHYEHD